MTDSSGEYNGTSTPGNSCTICPAGSYCTGGAANKEACTTGSYTSTTGQSACTPCTSGTTTNDIGQTSCNATCPNKNNYANAWATTSWSANTVTNLCKISNCNAGSKYDNTAYTDYTGTCTACTAGTYTTGTAHTKTSCSKVQSGCYGGTGATSACPKKCTAGSYSGTGASACTKCAAGSYSKAGASACSKCSIGQYQPAEGKSSCLTCATGTYSATVGATSCTACKPGNYCTGGRMKTCAAGSYSAYSRASSCTKCAAGTYQPATGKTSCLDAVAGYYVSNTGQTKQTPCTELYYQDEIGQANCKSCPPPSNSAFTSIYSLSSTGVYDALNTCWTRGTITNDTGTINLTCGASDTTGTYEYNCRTDNETVCAPGYYFAGNAQLGSFDNVITGSCSPVGEGRYFAGGQIENYNTAQMPEQCPADLTTIGYGTGANEADDCGRELHAGNNVIYLRSAQRTTPSLHVKVDDKIFYGALSTSLPGALKINFNNIIYSVVNDYQ